MLESLITSKTRIKLLMKFFINSNTQSYLRNLESEFGDSTNAIRVELNRLENANLLTSSVVGNKKIYQANKQHPLFGDIHSLLLKHMGLDQLVEVVVKLGDVESAWITGDIAEGRNGKVIDLVLIGKNFDKTYLVELVDKAEKLVGRHIRFMTVDPVKQDEFINDETSALQIWGEEVDKR
ncbi:ArsR family transcriptional regulator [Puteibacter caeruleilacunae]|nr:ArsR family transcriptional regulator [Puteibacter caeruleilacunae]